MYQVFQDSLIGTPKWKDQKSQCLYVELKREKKKFPNNPLSKQKLKTAFHAELTQCIAFTFSPQSKFIWKGFFKLAVIVLLNYQKIYWRNTCGLPSSLFIPRKMEKKFHLQAQSVDWGKK